MRVGYCDAHIEANRGSSGPTLTEISGQLDDVKHIVSTNSLRAMKSHEEVKERLASIQDSIPSAAAARETITGAIGNELLDALPPETVQHLIEAWLARQQGRPNDARVGTAKAVESVFTRLVKDRLHEVHPALKIHITRPNGSQWLCALGSIGRIQLSEWATVLGDIAQRSELNRDLEAAIEKAFPDANRELLGRCASALRDASVARGQSAHDPDRETYEDAVEKANTLWSITVGSPSLPGVLSRLCEALGVQSPPPG